MGRKRNGLLTRVSTHGRLVPIMADLSDRQNKILQSLIEEYIETAAAVGSEVLEKKYNLGVSPATIRNEMAELTRLGYFKQPHTSAGRVPTPMALKYYVRNLMKPKDLSVSEEVAVKEKLWNYRTEFNKTLSEATRELARRTKSLAVAMDNQDNVYYAGTANILDMPEFYDIDLTKTVLSLLDRIDYINKLFARGVGDEDIHILMGDELGIDYLQPCGLVYARFGEGKKFNGAIGVIGPYRFNYPVLIPTIRYFGGLIDELVGNW